MNKKYSLYVKHFESNPDFKIRRIDNFFEDLFSISLNLSLFNFIKIMF